MRFRTALFLAVSLGGMIQAHDVITTKITWAREVSRIVYKNCLSCHRDGGKAFSLATYEEARPWAKAIKDEVLARRMPPWNAVKGFGEFANDRGLTQEQIEVLAEWVEGGAPEGNPAYLPKTPRLDGEKPAAVKASKVLVKGSKTLAAPLTVAGVEADAIPPGGAVQVTARRPDGTVEPLLWVQAFQPGFNQPYWFKSPMKFPRGTVIETSPPGATASLLAK